MINTTIQKRKGFTLIELLVVIAIIGLLAGLLFPAVTAALTAAKKAKAKTLCQNVESAVMMYFNEYNGRLPTKDYGEDDIITDDETQEDTSKEILMTLMAIGDVSGSENHNHFLNPKKIVFLETDIPTDDGTLRDPWGEQIKIILDRDMNGRIEYLNTGDELHRKRAIVVSAGKNKEFGDYEDKDTENKDNVGNVDFPALD